MTNVLPDGRNVGIDYALDGKYGALDEKVLTVIRVTARHIGQKYTLTKIVGHLYKVASSDHTSYRRRARRNVVPRLKSVGLWSVEELKNNQLRIEAGPALEALLEHVFAYWASRQAQFFGEKKESEMTCSTSRPRAVGGLTVPSSQPPLHTPSPLRPSWYLRNYWFLAR